MRPDRRRDETLPTWAVASIALLWLAAGLFIALITGRITVRATGGYRKWWRWPWLHWCMFDLDCRADGCPKRLYVHVLGFYVDFD